MHEPTLFDAQVGTLATLNYEGCERVGVIAEVEWICGQLNYKLVFRDFDEKKKPYFWSAIYPSDYVKLL